MLLTRCANSFLKSYPTTPFSLVIREQALPCSASISELLVLVLDLTAALLKNMIGFANESTDYDDVLFNQVESVVL